MAQDNISQDPNTAATAAVCDWIEKTAKELCAALTGRPDSAESEAFDDQSDTELALVYNLDDQVAALHALVERYVFGPVQYCDGSWS